MQRKTIGPWDIEFDHAVAVTLYERATPGSEDCGCADCRNFAVGRIRAYPQQAIELFDSLGIDHAKEIDVFRPAGPNAGRDSQIYTGWFVFVGWVLSGPEQPVEGALLQPSDAGWPHLLTPDFGIGFCQQQCGPMVSWLETAGTQLPIAWVEFTTRVPWVLDEPDFGSGLQLDVRLDPPPQ